MVQVQVIINLVDNSFRVDIQNVFSINDIDADSIDHQGLLSLKLNSAFNQIPIILDLARRLRVIVQRELFEL